MNVRVGVVAPSPGEHTDGDGWGVLRDAGRLTIALVDGLGLGVDSVQARRVALTALALIWRDACRGTDDATVVVAALSAQPEPLASGPLDDLQALSAR